MNRISKSLVGTFEFCPYKAKLWMDDIPATDAKAHAMKRGSWLHETFENFYKKMEVAKADEALNVSHASLQKYFEEVCHQIKPADLTDGNKDIKNFCLWNTKQFVRNREEFMPIYIEEKIYLPDEDIVGVIDRVDKHDGKIRIIDYKSGYGGSKDIEKFRFELSIYAHLIEKQHNLEVDQWGIYFCGDNILLLEDVNKSYYERWATRKIEKLKHAIKMDDFPKTEWVAGCQGCEYFTHCWR